MEDSRQRKDYYPFLVEDSILGRWNTIRDGQIVEFVVKRMALVQFGIEDGCIHLGMLIILGSITFCPQKFLLISSKIFMTIGREIGNDAFRNNPFASVHQYCGTICYFLLWKMGSIWMVWGQVSCRKEVSKIEKCEFSGMIINYQRSVHV